MTVPDTVTAGRADIATATRVVVKVGSSSLTTPDGEIDDDRIGAPPPRCPPAVQDGGQVVLVSSGAIASGLVPLGLSRRPRDVATQQAAASVGQGLLIARYTAAFARHGIGTGQVLLSADDLMRRTHYRNAQRTLDRLLELGVLPVVNENDTVATDEIRFGDNDRLAARSRTSPGPGRSSCSPTWTASTTATRAVARRSGSPRSGTALTWTESGWAAASRRARELRTTRRPRASAGWPPRWRRR